MQNLLTGYKEMNIMTIRCPFCNKIQNQEPLKSWKYGISIQVGRYKCQCGKFFNHYNSGKSIWTIPKTKS